MKTIIRIANIAFILTMTASISSIKATNYVSQVWQGDLGNGSYRNPILHSDYSDPDVCSSGKGDYYMTASSFNGSPGLPILHSRDLVNWNLINYALPTLIPTEFYNQPQHGRGVWAPCIRLHKGEYFIYWGDPDFGIYMIKAKNPAHTWSTPILVKEGKGLIDPTPLWDEDGKAYLAFAWANSRARINSVIMVCELSADGTKTIGHPVMVFDGNDGTNHTVEGPKFYKRNGYYYIMAPAGGVETGWQLAMRSRHIYGPYQPKIVMAQGSTAINGPHQGAWIETPKGESWFLHFQDKAMYGRVLHLNPMTWVEDWPVIGTDSKGSGCGEPVTTYRKPNVGKTYPITTPAESDEFNTAKIGLQWSWHANYQDTFGFPSNYGFMRIYNHTLSPQFVNLWEAPNLLLQKFPAEEFTASTRLTVTAKTDGDQAGLIVMGWDYGYISLTFRNHQFLLEQSSCKDAEQGNPEQRIRIAQLPVLQSITEGSPIYSRTIHLRVTINKGGICTFAYSTDGTTYLSTPHAFTARAGKWIGAKVGLFSVRNNASSPRGWVDADWFRITKND